MLAPMRHDVAISTLRGHLPTLQRDVGVRRISLFGSTARDEAREDGDLDLLVEFAIGPTVDSFMRLEFFLEGQLGRKVDLVTADALKPRMRPVVEREMVDVVWQAGLAAPGRRHHRLRPRPPGGRGQVASVVWAGRSGFAPDRKSPMSAHDTFNRSAFSQFINSSTGRVLRLVAGAGFLVVGDLYRDHLLGLLSMAWSVLPLSAGAFDLCYISALLGGPLAGARIRAMKH
jgi:predicted nucleotidyltransferase